MGVKVKVCGLTRLADVVAAAAAGADMLGFIKEPSSPRFISDAHPLNAYHAYAPFLPFCAVFGPFRPEAPLEAFSHVQSADTMPVGARKRWMKVVQISDEETLASLTRRAQGEAVVVLDRASPLHGGTGTAIDWGLAAELVASLPHVKFVLAGGLGPDNVAKAVRQVRPYAVDASSRLESAPGEKDEDKVRAFVVEAKGS